MKIIIKIKMINVKNILSFINLRLFKNSKYVNSIDLIKLNKK